MNIYKTAHISEVRYGLILFFDPIVVDYVIYPETHHTLSGSLWPILLTWINFNNNM